MSESGVKYYKRIINGSSIGLATTLIEPENIFGGTVTISKADEVPEYNYFSISTQTQLSRLVAIRLHDLFSFVRIKSVSSLVQEAESKAFSCCKISLQIYNAATSNTAGAEYK
ncbi:hypothetical protein TcasGA2_TC009868 [Tribolium castaneum]|uniref:Uncharacterized protein n=1 Tax=Tribolium castaneum TaxID=7070 RepID=D6WQ42_TRICA|nr:hypothetical protein TcasGA2_TC009868 [Tribolium castaneum]